jgi:hypothetical protein
VPWNVELKRYITLVRLADQYCSLAVVSQPIEDHLLALPHLPETVAHCALDFLTVASKIRSRKLFRDAFIHTVGRWKILRHQHHYDEDWPDGLRAAIDAEYMRICELTIKVDRGLLAVSVVTGQDPMAIHNLAVWMKQSASQDTGEGTLYRKIALSNFEADREFCRMIGEITDPLLKNNLGLARHNNFGHLTCAELTGKEFPWDSEEAW